MYAMVRELKVKDSFRDENIRRVNEQLLPKMRAIPGFIDYYLIYAEHGVEFAVALFKDKQGADAYRTAVAEIVRDAGPNLDLQLMTEGPVVAQAHVPVTA